MTKIYHNPRCSKSRQTLELLQSKGIEPEVIEYLKTPPSAAELDEVLKKLHLEPQDITRSKEKTYEELDLKEKKLSRQEMIQVLVKNPILIERPIVVQGAKAAIGRPPEKVLEIL
ncbi:MAG: arsenate reductase (glutaredoxin) [Deltaproteobacteria bacterium]|nr:arsenate reductase (glutaredoxin) [Deltaproteobacteria bacterium]